jgi:colanic acid biosynthesis glycosyl transferase WcaI
LIVRILVVTNHFWPENFRINDLAFWLAERRHDVTVLTGVPNYPAGKFFPGYGIFKRRFEIHRGVKIKRFPLIPRGKGRSWNLALDYLSSALTSCLLAPFYCRGRYDLVFVFETSPVTIGLPALVIKRQQSIPLIFWVLDLWPESLSATGAIRSPTLLELVRRLVRFIYARCDRLLVSSRGFCKSVAETGGYKGGIEYFPNWVEPEYTSDMKSEQVSLPDLPEGFRIMFAGNIGAAQDFETILQAAEQLRGETDIHWVILGDGRRAEWLKSEVAKRGLDGSFHMLGRHPAEMMPSFFERADALLLTLRREPIFALTVPGKLQSYMASGKPVIAGLDGEGAALVLEAGGGLACPAESPVELAGKVLEMYRMSQEERQLMGARGRQFCAENFNREKQFNKIEGMMMDLAVPTENQAVARENG